ncbi:MAG: efflux RND transporter periplasmic adaptor subunit [Pseudomonadota bacterium]
MMNNASVSFLTSQPLVRRAGSTTLAGALCLVLAACGPADSVDKATAGSPAAAAAPASAASADTGNRALTVTVVRPTPSSWPLRLSANGNVTAWQEATIGSQSTGLALKEVLVNVGDTVQRGQLLASFDAATLAADINQLRAQVAEAEAMLQEAAGNAARVRALGQPMPGAPEGEVGLVGGGALSAQQVDQYLTAEATARARVTAQRAALQSQTLRLAQAQVRAPDSGVISARQATVGAVVPAGQELFRLIRQGRLEWRAEVSAAELPSLKVGSPVSLRVETQTLTGTVRQIAPTVDPATRNALVYVDLPEAEVRRTGVKAGMFARGDVDLGASQALSLPQTAVMLRDGFSTVMRVGPEGKVSQVKVQVGRRLGDRIELTGGLPADAEVVAAGIGFLSDGDRVRVVAGPAAAVPAAGAASAPATAAAPAATSPATAPAAVSSSAPPRAAVTSPAAPTQP